jgi:hypothetical protein
MGVRGWGGIGLKRWFSEFRGRAVALLIVGALLGAGLTAAVFVITDEDGAATAAAARVGKLTVGRQQIFRLTAAEVKALQSSKNSGKARPRPNVVRGACRDDVRVDRNCLFWFNRAETLKIMSSNGGAMWAICRVGFEMCTYSLGYENLYRPIALQVQAAALVAYSHGMCIRMNQVSTWVAAAVPYYGGPCT